MAAAMGFTWMGAVGGMQGSMRQEWVEQVYLNGAQVQVLLMGMVNTNVMGSICLGKMMAAWSHGRSTKASWTRMGLWVGQLVPDLVGVVDIMPSRFNLMREGGGLVVEAGGGDLLVLHITEFEAGMLVIWRGSRGAWGSLPLEEVCMSLHVSPSPSYSGFLGLPAWSPDPTYMSHWGLCSLLLGLHSSASSLTICPSLLALAITADLGGVTSVINVVLTLAVMGAAETRLDGAGF